MSADLYTDRDGDVWAVRGDGTAVCVAARGNPTGDTFGGCSPDFRFPWVEDRFGPLLRLESTPAKPTLHQHAAAINTALANAAADGLYLDDGMTGGVYELDLNDSAGNFVRLAVPQA